MANVIHRRTLEYRTSVDTKEYLDGNWLINPDFSLVEGVDRKYWIVDGQTLRPMTHEEINQKYVKITKYEVNEFINDYRTFVFQSGFFWQGFTYETNEQSQANIIATVAFILSGQPLPPNFVWRVAEDISVPHTAESFMAMFLNAIGWINQLYGLTWQMKSCLARIQDYFELLAFKEQILQHFPKIVLGFIPKTECERCPIILVGSADVEVHT